MKVLVLNNNKYSIKKPAKFKIITLILRLKKKTLTCVNKNQQMIFSFLCLWVILLDKCYNRFNNRTLSSICKVNVRTRFAHFTLASHYGFYVIKNQNCASSCAKILL